MSAVGLGQLSELGSPYHPLLKHRFYQEDTSMLPSQEI